MKSILREPLLHFFVLGLLVFGLFALFDDTQPISDERTIAVTSEDALRLAAEFEALWRRQPSLAELEGLVAQFIREEVYAREAVVLGLDQNDAIIRRRLQQKMEFLTETGANAVNPDDETLAAHMEAYPDRFSLAPVIAFDQITLRDDIPLERIPEIVSTLDLGADMQEVSRSSLLPSAVPLSAPRVVDSIFGTGFFVALATLPTGRWSGPVESSFGRHLVRVLERRPGGLPPLSDVRERVLQDWQSTLAVELREQRYNAMLMRYKIVETDLQDVLTK